MLPNQEPQIDQKRFVFAMLISGAIILLWQMYFAPQPPLVDPAVQQEVAQKEDGSKGDEPVANLKDDPEQVDEKIAPADKIELSTTRLRTSKFQLDLTNRGGRINGVEILDPAQYQAAGDLLEIFPDDSKYFPFGIGFAKDSINIPDNVMYQVAASTETSVTYRHVDAKGRYVVDKTYTIIPDKAYELELEVKITNQLEDARISDQLTLDAYGYKDPTDEKSFFDMRPDQLEALCRTTSDTEREFLSGVETPLIWGEEPVVWAGIDRRYFLFAMVPEKNASACEFAVDDADYLRARLIQDEFSIASGESYSMKYQLFVGPKDQDVLDAAGSKLSEAIDYGFFTFLARPMRWLLVKMYSLVGNWGFAIILLTILIRLLMWPINHKVYANSERMKDIQPKLTEIRAKYENDQQRLAEETMKVFRENNVSALGCAPMFLQFPIFLALYFMILNSVELYQANFAFWYTDLSASDPYFVLPILMGGVMYVQQSMMTVETPNPQMQTVMKIMPVTFTVFMLFLPSGVVLYYSASMLIGIAQQFWIKRSFAKKREAAGNA